MATNTGTTPAHPQLHFQHTQRQLQRKAALLINLAIVLCSSVANHSQIPQLLYETQYRYESWESRLLVSQEVKCPAVAEQLSSAAAAKMPQLQVTVLGGQVPPYKTKAAV